MFFCVFFSFELFFATHQEGFLESLFKANHQPFILDWQRNCVVFIETTFIGFLPLNFETVKAAEQIYKHSKACILKLPTKIGEEAKF
jgi:hypothetical protein